jgi:hypothetical protein
MKEKTDQQGKLCYNTLISSTDRCYRRGRESHMEMNEKLIREVKKKLEIEMLRKEAEIVEYWKKELDVIYRKKYDGLSSLQIDIKALMERMNNRALIVSRMAKEEK